MYNKTTQLVKAGVWNQASLSLNLVHFNQWSSSLKGKKEGHKHSEDVREINSISQVAVSLKHNGEFFSYICVTHANINFVLVYFIVILKYKYYLCLTSRLSHTFKWFPEESFLKIALQSLLWPYLQWFIHACIQLLIYLCIPKKAMIKKKTMITYYEPGIEMRNSS